MSGARKARNTASIINHNQVGVKSGLAPTRNATNVMFRAFRNLGAQNTATVPSTIRGYAAQVAYLRNNNLVSRNPVASGGVGRRYPIAALNFK